MTRISRHKIGALIISCFLVSDIGSDLLQIKANRRDGVPTSPKVLAGEVAIATAELTGNGNRTLALKETDDRGKVALSTSKT